MDSKIRNFPGKAWVRLSGQLSEDSVKGLIGESEVLISDLDHTVGNSPAELSAKLDLKEHIFQPGLWGDVQFWLWCLGAGKNLASDLYRGGESGKIRSWVRYHDLYLKGKECRARRAERLSPERVRGLLYPGLEDFLALNRGQYKCFLTRNIPEFTRPFVDYLGFDHAITDVRDKGKEIAEFVERHAFQNYLVAGDFEVMPNLEVLEFYRKRGVITSLTSINVAGSKREIDERADINIGRDYRGLVALITER